MGRVFLSDNLEQKLNFMLSQTLREVCDIEDNVG